MMQCDMCGAEGQLFTARIEGTEMKVCEKCARFGKVISKVVVKKIERKPRLEEPEVIEAVVKNYPSIIKDAREKKGKTQEELAKILNLKTSLLTNMERGKFKPSVEMARKLEKELHIRLVEQVKEELFQQKRSSSAGFTIGDFMK